MLVDEVDITVTAGHGGPGKVSFDRAYKSGPDGGDGGLGGSVYVNATSDLTALVKFSSEYDIKAEHGFPGGSKKQHGKNGADTELIMPIGTSLIDRETGENIELAHKDDRVLLCKGGLGGRGNFQFRSSTNQRPQYAQPGLPGQYRQFKVILRFLADFGLVGLPNAGKSSILNEITNANAQIGAYPFTTLEPNLGVLRGRVIADIPGLIEGASGGKGLGTKFLKHIEKVKTLLHCIAADSADVLHDYKIINKELADFDPKLLEKPQIILLTKTDLVDEKTQKQQIKKLSTTGHKIIPLSIHDLDSIKLLSNSL